MFKPESTTSKLIVDIWKFNTCTCIYIYVHVCIEENMGHCSPTSQFDQNGDVWPKWKSVKTNASMLIYRIFKIDLAEGALSFTLFRKSVCTSQSRFPFCNFSLPEPNVMKLIQCAYYQ